MSAALAGSPPRPTSAQRPHRPSPQLDAALVLQQAAQQKASIGAARFLHQPAQQRSQSFATSQPSSPSPTQFHHSHLTSSPSSGHRDGSFAPPSTPLPTSMGMAGGYTRPAFATQPRASTSQAVFRSHVGVGAGSTPPSTTGAHRSYTNTPELSPTFSSGSSLSSHTRSRSSASPALGSASKVGGSISFSPLVRASAHTGSSPLLFAGNGLEQASPMMLGQSGSFNADDSEDDLDASSTASASLLSPTAYSRSAQPPATLTPVRNGPTGQTHSPAQTRSPAVPPGTLAYASNASVAPASAHKCSTCGAGFSAKGSLVRHEATHPAVAQARLDEEDDEDAYSRPEASASASKRFASHPEGPVHVNDVSRRTPPLHAQALFPAFSPSEMRPYSSPSPQSSGNTKSPPAKAASASASPQAFPPFSPSEAQPLGSPPPAAGASGGSASKFGFNTSGGSAAAAASPVQFPPFSPSEVQQRTASGFSPSHAHWRDDAQYDEVFEVEGSDDGASVQGSPQAKRSSLRAAEPVSPVRESHPPRIQMSPATRSAADQLVPSLSWLLILSRKLVLSGAVSVEQGRHIKRAVLSGDVRLLSAVEKFIDHTDEGAIVEALMMCLPEEAPQQQQAASRQTRFTAPAGASDSADSSFDDSYAEEDDAQSPAEDSDDARAASFKRPSDSRVTASPAGRGPGGYKGSRSRPVQYDDEDESDDGDLAAAADESPAESEVGASEDDGVEQSDEEQPDPLVIANSLVPLKLPQLEALHTLLRELGFHLIDLETLSLCTSTLLPSTPRGSQQHPSGLSGVAKPLQPVTLAAWQSCVKSLRLHSHAPKLFTQLMTAVFHALDINSNNQVPSGELLATVSIFCRASSHRSRLQFIFDALLRSHNAETAALRASGVSSSPASPREPDSASLPRECIYGFLFSSSLALHLLLRASEQQLRAGQDASLPLTEQQLSEVTQAVGVHAAEVWTLTNGLYALYDSQFRHGGQNEDEEEQEELAPRQDISYAAFLRWQWHPSYVLDALLQ